MHIDAAKNGSDTSMTPTQRTLKALRNDGWHCEVVEHWNSFAHKRVDLFNCDILAIKMGCKPLLCQVTSTGVAKRMAKIRAMDNLETVLDAFTVEVHGWRRPLKNGKPHGKYVQRIETIT